MKTKLLALALMAGSTMFAGTRFFVGVGVNAPVYYAPRPVPVVAYVPPSPGYGYTWVAGSWYPGHVWHAGYWAAPRYERRFVAPRYYGNRYRR